MGFIPIFRGDVPDIRHFQIATESHNIQQMDSVVTSITSNTLEAYRNFYNTRIPLNHPTSSFRQASTTSFGAPSGSTFTQTSTLGKPAFGGQQAGGFGAFGTQANATTSTSAFGQPPPNSSAATAFGQPSTAFGVSAFGAGATLKPPTATAFGQTAAFGTSVPATAFGAPAPAPALGFGARPGALAFGTTTTASAFGTQPAVSAFGAAPAAPAFGSPTKFGESTFGTSTTPSTTVSAFGNAPAFGQAQASANNSASGFGQSQPVSAFGQTPAFGQPSAFGQSAFGKPAAFGANAPTSTTSFGQTAFGQASAFGQSAFGQTTPATSTSLPTSAPSKASSTPASGFAAFANNTSATPSFASPPSAQSSTFAPTPVMSAFGQPTQTPSSVTSLAGNAPAAFGSTNASVSAFGTGAQASSNHQGDTERVVKEKDPWWADAPKESDLPPELLVAFQKQSFTWDLIPHLPPPITLR